jgi:ABC-type transport system involved in multi-copper enzyme maturation permease subunit
MNAKTMRIVKEARSLFWPWCAVIIAGALPLVGESHSALIAGPWWGVHYLIEPLSFLGFFLGIPLLATLSMGNEFQHRTLPLLLSQPIDRIEIWREKMSVSIVATLSATFVFCLSWRTALQQAPELWMEAGAWIIAMVASATLWTLIARSTLGGMVLTGGVHYFLFIPLLLRPDWVPETMTTRSIAAFLVFGYAAVMLWLGRRTLARFQVTGGLAGDNLLTAGPSVIPEAWAEWFRCRPTGLVLNLIRKELRLLRPLWLITPLGLAGWMYVSMFGDKSKRGSVLAVIMATAVTPLIAVLAGNLSVGEERSSGMHSWHMTLPVSARRQWLIKLSTALFVGLVCSVFLPTLELNLIGPPSMFVDAHQGMEWVLMVLLLSFASFWCACAVNGTVRAALWLFPAIGSLVLAGRFGNWVGSEAMNLVVSRFDLFTDFRFTNAVSNLQRFVVLATPLRVITFLLLPTLLIATIQGYRMFREQAQDSILSVARRLFPLAIAAFLSTFSWMALYALVANAQQQMWTMFRETHEAIERIQPDTAKLDATHPLQLTAEDLVKAAPLSERTQRWLRDARISVAPDKPHPGAGGRYCCGGNSRSIRFAPDRDYSRYLAVIRLPSGSDCTVSFQAGRGNGMLGGVCE